MSDTTRICHDAGAEICMDDENGRMRFVPAWLYEKNMEILLSRIRKRDEVVAANISPETWAEWRAAAE